MSSEEILKVPCSRCEKPHKVRESVYHKQGGNTYCQDCLVPFTCDSCGMRRQTIPENVSRNTSLTCRHCASSGSSTEEQNNWGFFNVWYWAEGITGLISVIVGINIIAFVLLSIQEMDQMNTAYFTPVDWGLFLGGQLTVLFLLLVIASALWDWKPYSNSR